ncbi:hypothetical protein, conserved [Angomonas deanei]|uniref:Uncharacterized protein n=1 Tax=Angomonas deanei TaxID=59799 RepID=A0A7G2CE73_9TRYP|nr:hypothetical protein, conserved [Angomonas deanei]
MYRLRKEINATGGYHHSVLNHCVRPLLQLADYPFKPEDLTQMVKALDAGMLREALSDIGACRRFKVFYSQETDRLLDWSDEDFLRRRYESIHLSWEPLDVVFQRFNWSSDVLSDKDALLFFSKYTDYIELAELTHDRSGNIKAEPIDAPETRAEEDPIPLSRILVRRVADEFAEPSLTETIRLKGAPALKTPVRGKKKFQPNEKNVGDVVGAMDDAVEEVDGSETDRIKHAVESTTPHRQATRHAPIIKEFSVSPKQEQKAAQEAAQEEEAVEETNANTDVASLTEAYHAAKVQVSLLRRQLLRSDDVDNVENIQARLNVARKKLSDVTQQLNEAKLNTVSPRQYPQYAEAPEYSTAEVQKNEEAAEEDEALENEINASLREFDSGENLETTSSAANERNAKEAEDVEDDIENIEVEAAEERQLTVLEQLAEQRNAALEQMEKYREELNSLLDKKERVLSALQGKIDSVEGSIKELEGQIDEINASEADEKKRLEDEEMEREKESRMRALEKQREEARKAQAEAEMALKRQKEAEMAAQMLEKQLNANQNGEEELQEDLEASAEQETEDAGELAEHVEAAAEESSPAVEEDTMEAAEEQAAPATTNGFTCTPEQYDGLHLAAVRLRREIAALESQMTEEEGGEDDETLMAVLAASRSDLEELDECIASVQANTTWAKVRDAARRKEEEMQTSENSEYQGAQDKIEQLRFSISLLEKRMLHTTKRSVLNKLEQNIIQLRGEINKLRMEQDRLRRAGATSMGLPSSISVAETLAFESKKSSAQQLAEEVRRVAEEEKESSAAPETHEDTTDETETETVTAATHNSADAEKLRLRLNTMVESIQHLQDTIGSNEGAAGTDAGTEATLMEMREKLTMLLKLRDDIQSRLIESSEKKEAAGASTGVEVIRPASFAPVAATPARYPLSPASTRKKLKKTSRRLKKMKKASK